MADKWTTVSVRELNGCLLFLQNKTLDSPSIREAKKQIQIHIDFMLQNGMQEIEVEENELTRAIKLLSVKYNTLNRFERR